MPRPLQLHPYSSRSPVQPRKSKWLKILLARSCLSATAGSPGSPHLSGG
jgi:hypothetical protein